MHRRATKAHHGIKRDVTRGSLSKEKEKIKGIDGRRACWLFQFDGKRDDWRTKGDRKLCQMRLRSRPAFYAYRECVNAMAASSVSAFSKTLDAVEAFMGKAERREGDVDVRDSAASD